jgi:hypothetical protein
MLISLLIHFHPNFTCEQLLHQTILLLFQLLKYFFNKAICSSIPPSTPAIFFCSSITWNGDRDFQEITFIHHRLRPAPPGEIRSSS